MKRIWFWSTASARSPASTASQLALTWVLAQGDDIVPIPGTKRRTFLDENVAALDVELTSHDLERIAVLLPAGGAAGARYPESMMGLVDG